MQENVKEEALKYYMYGCRVVPFNAKEKRPLVEWQRWQTEPQTQEEFDSLPFDRADGFALVCGVKINNGHYLGVVDFDVKNLPEEVVERGRKAIPKFLTTQRERTPSGGEHLIYYCRDKPKTISAYHNEIGLELIGENKLVVMAPSVGYKRVNDNTPSNVNDLVEVFEKVLDSEGVKIKSKANVWFGREDLGGEPYRGKDPPCVFALLRGTREGLRNEYGIRLASYLVNFKNYQPNYVLKKLEEWNGVNEPKLTKDELQNILKSAIQGQYIYGCSDPILWKNCESTRCRIAPKEVAKHLEKEDKEKAETILSSPNLLQFVLKFAQKRLVGESRASIINFINICSGQTRYPISSIVEGYSGSGKNESLRCIKPLIPEAWLFEFTTSTPEAVKYIPEDFAGTLIIYEASGMQSKTGTLGLRAIGEGESIETIYPMRDESTGKMTLGRAKTNARNFITTESDVDVHPDLYRRVLKTSMNHSINLTRRVLGKKIREARLPESLKAFLNLTDRLEFNVKDFQNALIINEWNKEVVLFPPFNLMKLLGMAVTTEQKVALRTHIEKFLNFVRVLSLLHQKNRVQIKVGESNYVVACPDDFWLALDVLESTIKSTISRLGKRQEEVLQLFEVTNPLTKHDVAKQLGISEDTAYKTLKALYKNGYLNEDKTGGKGQAYSYHLLNKPKAFGIWESRGSSDSVYQKELENLLEGVSAIRNAGVAVEIRGIDILNMCTGISSLFLTRDTPTVRIAEPPSKPELSSFSENKPEQPRLSDIPNGNGLEQDEKVLFQICCVCHEEKPLTEFSKMCGRPTCKRCAREEVEE